MSGFWKRYRRNLGGVIGLALIVLVILVALTASLFFPHSPWQMRGLPLLEPFDDPQFPLGTDMLGRDIASGLAYGARVSLIVGTVSTLCCYRYRYLAVVGAKWRRIEGSTATFWDLVGQGERSVDPQGPTRSDATARQH